jgi:hypothetical protein
VRNRRRCCCYCLHLLLASTSYSAFRVEHSPTSLCESESENEVPQQCSYLSSPTPELAWKRTLRSYLDPSNSTERKEFILKLLSSDPSNYPDAPTGKNLAFCFSQQIYLTTADHLSTNVVVTPSRRDPESTGTKDRKEFSSSETVAHG